MSQQILNDYMPNKQNVAGLKGSVTVQLFDAKSKKVLVDYTSDNFIANFAKEYFAYLERVNFNSQMNSLSPNSNSDIAPYSSSLTALVLSDCADSPDPDNEWMLAGNLVGYSTKANYSGADTMRGTPNGQFCETSTTSTKWVFDWPTHSANGTIKSISWMAENYQAFSNNGNGRVLNLPTVLNNGSTLLKHRVAPFSNNQPISLISNNRLATGQGTTVSVFEENNTPVTTFTTISCSGLTWDKINEKLWVISGNQIASYTQSGSIVDSPISITPRSYRGLTFDGTDLWTIASGVVYRISLAGVDVSSFTPSFGTLGNSNTYIGDVVWDNFRSVLIVLAIGYSSWRYGFGYATNHDYVLCTQHYNKTGVVLSMGTCINPWNGSRNIFTLNAGTDSGYGGSASDVYRYFDIKSPDTFAVTVYSGSLYPTGNRIMDIRADGMGSRILLPSPITKTSAHTFRVSYTLTYA